MKSFSRSIVCLCSLLILGRAASAETLPAFRPALIGNHKKSLINLIDAESLMKRGQKDAIVMFECGVTELGDGVNSRTYRESPNSELFRKELMGRLDQAQFIPAVYNHVHVGVYVHGTATFLIHDGKPHLRIFLNQSDEDLKSGKDFVEPQFAFVPTNSKFQGIYYPPQAIGHSGVATLKLNVSATGRVESASVVYEYPAGMNFGPQAAGPIRDALFIPGFRNGKPVDCQFNWTLIYTGPGRQMKTG